MVILGCYVVMTIFSNYEAWVFLSHCLDVIRRLRANLERNIQYLIHIKYD